MYLPFDQLPATARVWIYQADRFLSQTECGEISSYLAEATEHWNAHGAPLKASFKIVKDRFVIVAADESYNAASGCSIDTSSNWLKLVGNRLHVSFFDRSLLYVKSDGEIDTLNPFGVKKHVENGELLAETPVFTQQIADVAALQNWPVPAGTITQYKRFFKNEIADA